MIKIVDAEIRHLDDIEKIEHECFSLPWTKEQLLNEFPDERHVFIVAESEEGEALGYVGLMHIIDEGYIANVAVASKARRQGIADMLIDELDARSRSLELAFMTLEVRESNAPAIALYSKHGFVPVGLRKNYYEQPRENALLMTKSF